MTFLPHGGLDSQGFLSLRCQRWVKEVSEKPATVVPDKRRLLCVPPEMLFRVLFLEVWGNVSDVEVCRELGYNVLYRHFCGIGWGEAVPDDTTLVVFRRRLGEGTFRRLGSWNKPGTRGFSGASGP